MTSTLPPVVAATSALKAGDDMLLYAKNDERLQTGVRVAGQRGEERPARPLARAGGLRPDHLVEGQRPATGIGSARVPVHSQEAKETMNEYLQTRRHPRCAAQDRRAAVGLAARDDLHPQGPVPHASTRPVGERSRCSWCWRSPPSICTGASSPGPRPASCGPGRRVHSVFGLIFVPLRAAAVRRPDRGQPERAPEHLLDLRASPPGSPSTRDAAGCAFSSCSARSP